MGPVLYWATSSIRYLYLSGGSGSLHPLSIGWKINSFSFCSCSFEATGYVRQRPLCLYCLWPWAIELIPTKLLNFLSVRIRLPLSIVANWEKRVQYGLSFLPCCCHEILWQQQLQEDRAWSRSQFEKMVHHGGSSRQQLLEATGCITSAIRKQRKECTLVLSRLSPLYTIQDALPREWSC